jgi:hypothetical protein
MSGIVGGMNLRSSGLINLGSASDGQVFTGTGAGLPVGFEAAAGGGKCLQIVSSINTSTASNAGATWTDIASLTVDITPASTSNTILVWCMVSFCVGAVGNRGGLRVLRESTAIGVGDAASARIQTTQAAAHISVSNSFNSNCVVIHDSPSADSEITYKVQGQAQAGATWYVNQSIGDSDTDAYQRTASSIVVMEISA